eukprot:1022212-Amphidinium_carterae.3
MCRTNLAAVCPEMTPREQHSKSRQKSSSGLRQPSQVAHLTHSTDVKVQQQFLLDLAPGALATDMSVATFVLYLGLRLMGARAGASWLLHLQSEQFPLGGEHELYDNITHGNSWHHSKTHVDLCLAGGRLQSQHSDAENSAAAHHSQQHRIQLPFYNVRPQERCIQQQCAGNDNRPLALLCECRLLGHAKNTNPVS